MVYRRELRPILTAGFGGNLACRPELALYGSMSYLPGNAPCWLIRVAAERSAGWRGRLGVAAFGVPLPLPLPRGQGTVRGPVVQGQVLFEPQATAFK